ncbi:MAG: hypothetical protein K2I73_06785 [Eubacterium sp.]|nr:hypothetical protein [Eubacterium sp.]
MKFLLFDINGRAFEAESILSYELTAEAEAPCDGLRLSFLCHSSIGEICNIKAYRKNKLVFNGFCDKQKVTFSESGKICFIYARSSAALLVDNEAVPCQYENPSARQLWFSNAKAFGFKTDLPEIYSSNSYLVSKGTSCYGAINDYVSAVSGMPVYATPENELKIYAQSKEVKRLEDYNVSSLSYVINRSEPIDEIDYKINSADNYSYHFKSDFVQKMGIQRKRMVNLSSIPLWQREMNIEKIIKKALDEYYSVSVVLLGNCDLALYDRMLINAEDTLQNEEFYIAELTFSKNKNGERTTALLKKNIDGEMVNYVA